MSGIRDGRPPRGVEGPLTAPAPRAGDHDTRPRPARLGGGPLRPLLAVALAFVLAGTLATGWTVFRIWQVGNQDGRHHADAIVVLGTAQYNGRPSPALKARLDHAIDLYFAGYAPWFVTTGGNQPGDWTTEAEVGRKYAISQGVPAAAILFENAGGTTYESMVNVRALLAAHGLHSALFVSDRSHMLRILRMAADQGIEAWSSPTGTSPNDAGSAWDRAALHELGAMAQYLLTQQDMAVPDLPDMGSAAATPGATAPPRPTASPSAHLPAGA